MRFARSPASVLGLALACLLATAGAGPARGGYTALYSDTTTFSSYGYGGGGATAVGADTITRLVADDINAGAGLAGRAVNRVEFSVANLNPTTVTAGVHLRIFAGDGAGGGPGTLLAAADFTPMTFMAGGVGIFSYASSTPIFAFPGGLFWAGIAFDNSNGTTGATAAQLNNLGQGVYAVPTLGSSSDLFFQSNAAGSFDGGNPPGGFYNLGGSPAGNFGWGFSTLSSVPEPSSLALSGVAGLALVGVRLVRRRRAHASA